MQEQCRMFFCSNIVLKQTDWCFVDRQFEGIDLLNYQLAGAEPCMNHLLVQSNQIEISFLSARTIESAMEFLWWATGACLLVLNQYVECINSLKTGNIQSINVFLDFKYTASENRSCYVARIFNAMMYT